MAINVLIADQERIFADALATRLDDEDDIGVMGAVQLKAPSAWAVTGKRSQVMLLDGDLPGDAANRICEQLSGCESTRIIMLSFSSEPERIVKAFQAGAAAWVGKNESLEHLLQVIRGVARGESWLPPSQTAGVVQLLLHAGEQRRQNECLLATLTARERAVLVCLAEGAAHRDAVAKQLHVSVNTVRTHLQNIMAKLGVHSTVEAVALTRDNPNWLHGDNDTLS
jgi:DNA-binding NarL/FixJ family response regulator